MEDKAIVWYLSDIWILDTNNDDAKSTILKDLSKDDKVKCCIITDNFDIKNALTGIARVITFENSREKDKKPTIKVMYEGYIKQASPFGFGRFIFNFDGGINGNFMGYFKYVDDVAPLVPARTQKGYGMLFSMGKPKYQGFYEDDSYFTRAPKT